MGGGGGAGEIPQAFFIAWSCLFCAREVRVTLLCSVFRCLENENRINKRD